MVLNSFLKTLHQVVFKIFKKAFTGGEIKNNSAKL